MRRLSHDRGGRGDGAREKRAKQAVDESYDPAVNFYRDDFYWIGSCVYVYVCEYMCEGREIKRTNEGYNITVYREH